MISIQSDIPLKKVLEKKKYWENIQVSLYISGVGRKAENTTLKVEFIMINRFELKNIKNYL